MKAVAPVGWITSGDSGLGTRNVAGEKLVPFKTVRWDKDRESWTQPSTARRCVDEPLSSLATSRPSDWKGRARLRHTVVSLRCSPPFQLLVLVLGVLAGPAAVAK